MKGFVVEFKAGKKLINHRLPPSLASVPPPECSGVENGNNICYCRVPTDTVYEEYNNDRFERAILPFFTVLFT